MEIKNKIIEFLDRNLVLDRELIKDIRESIDKLDNEQLEQVYKILLELDEKQTQALQEKLSQDPFFFFKMENEIFKEMYKKHLTEEKQEKEFIEAWIAKNLA